MPKSIELPSREYLNKIFYYERGKLFWKEKEQNSEKNDLNIKIFNIVHANKLAGTLKKNGYIQVCINKKIYLAHRIIWQMINGNLSTEEEIDHINLIKNQNNIENLRISSSSQNSHNLPITKRNKSGEKGIYFSQKENRWIASVTVMKNKKKKLFKNFNDALTWVKQTREVLHKDFANHGK